MIVPHNNAILTYPPDAHYGPTVSTPTFSKTIEQIENIISTLENSNTSLEDSLANFEQGIKLLRSAQAKLEKAEQKVMTLSDTSGDPNQ